MKLSSLGVVATDYAVNDYPSMTRVKKSPLLHAEKLQAARSQRVCNILLNSVAILMCGADERCFDYLPLSILHLYQQK